MSQWDSFFVAQVGASAALAGLVFVGVSINLTKIMSFGDLSGRALEAVVALLSVLLESSLLLVPGQPTVLLGAEILVVGLLVWASITAIHTTHYRKVGARYRWEYVLQIILAQVATLAFVLAGAAMVLRGGNGVYWIVPGVICCYLAAISEAWILLIEINR